MKRAERSELVRRVLALKRRLRVLAEAEHDLRLREPSDQQKAGIAALRATRSVVQKALDEMEARSAWRVKQRREPGGRDG